MQSGPASTDTHRQGAANPGYADLWRAQAKPLSILVACCTLLATSYSELMLTFLNQFASIYSFCFLIMLFALVLPARFFLLSIALAVGALKALSHVNELKISAVSLPMTFFDVKTVIADPTVLVNAIGIRDDLYKIVSIAVGVLAVCARRIRFLQESEVTLFWTSQTLAIARQSRDAIFFLRFECRCFSGCPYRCPDFAW